MSRSTQNGLVIVAALGAALVVMKTQTNWLNDTASVAVERERCFGVVKAGGNDCATPKHSCAAQSTKARDSQEWIMMPKGLCDKLAGASTEPS